MAVNTPADRPHTARGFGMFGIYRFLLASGVVIGHTARGGWVDGAQICVFAFYTLSGYLMASVWETAYRPQPDGVARYAVNRFLRIYPLYWIVMLAYVALMFAAPRELQRVTPGPAMYFLPLYSTESISIWLSNIILLGMVGLDGRFHLPFAVGTAWSAGIEVMYWALIPFLLRYSSLRRFMALFALFYLALVLIMNQVNPRFDWVAAGYFSPLAVSLPFMAGIYIFLLRRRQMFPYQAGHLLIAGLLGLTLLACLLGTSGRMFYVFFLLHAGTIYFLSGVDNPQLAKLDNALGNLAYAMYLLHQLAMALLLWIDPTLHIGSWRLTLYALPFTVLLAALAHSSVERPLQRLRTRVRNTAL